MNALLITVIVILAVSAILFGIKFYARIVKRRHLKKLYRQAELLTGKELDSETKKGIKKMLSDSLKK